MEREENIISGEEFMALNKMFKANVRDEYLRMVKSLAWDNLEKLGIATAVGAIGTFAGPVAGSVAGGSVALGGMVLALAKEWQDYKAACASKCNLPSKMEFMKTRGLQVLSSASLVGLGYVAKGATGVLGQAAEYLPMALAGVTGFVQGLTKAKKHGVQHKLARLGVGLANAAVGCLVVKGAEAAVSKLHTCLVKQGAPVMVAPAAENAGAEVTEEMPTAIASEVPAAPSEHMVLSECVDQNGMPYRVVAGEAGDGYFDRAGFHRGADGIWEKAASGTHLYNQNNYAEQLSAWQQSR